MTATAGSEVDAIVLVHPASTPTPTIWEALAGKQAALHEKALLEQGEWRAAAEWNADFWLSEASGSELRARIIEMQERALRLQSESEAEEAEHEPVDLGAVRARTLVAVGELDKPDMHAIAERLVRGIDGARAVRIDGAAHLPSLERPDVTARLVRDFLGR